MDATFVGYPAPFNPAYERERDQYEASDLERRMELADREARRCHALAVAADCEGRTNDAERLLNQRDAAEREWKRLQHELGDLENGW